MNNNFNESVNTLSQDQILILQDISVSPSLTYMSNMDQPISSINNVKFNPLSSISNVYCSAATSGSLICSNINSVYCSAGSSSNTFKTLYTDGLSCLGFNTIIVAALSTPYTLVNLSGLLNGVFKIVTIDNGNNAYGGICTFLYSGSVIGTIVTIISSNITFSASGTNLQITQAAGSTGLTYNGFVIKYSRS